VAVIEARVLSLSVLRQNLDELVRHLPNEEGTSFCLRMEFLARFYPPFPGIPYFEAAAWHYESPERVSRSARG
jgi:hypothetical protein